MNKKTSQSGQKLLLGLLVKKKNSFGKSYIEFQWFKIGLFLSGIFLVSWLLLSAGLYAFFKYYQEYDDVKFTKMMVFPFIIKDHRKAMGDYHIKKGLTEIENEQFSEGIHLLRLGLVRSPSNLEGRTTLAQIYEFGIKRKDIAIDMYLEGFKYDGINNNTFIVSALQSLLNNQMDKEIEAIAQKYLPTEYKIGDNENFQTLAFVAASSSFLRGNFDRAEDYINLFSLNSTIDGIILSAKISWDRGNQLTAINKLERTLATFPNSDAIFAQLGKFYRQTKNFDAARRYTQLRNVRKPSDPTPIIDLMYLHNDFEDQDSVEKLSNRILEDFSHDKEAIYKLANFASLTGNIRLAQRCYELVLEQEYELNKLALSLIEAYLVDKDFKGAYDFSEELLEENPTWLDEQKPLLNSLRALAAYGLNRPDLGDIYLSEFINKTNINTNIFVAVAGRFSSNEMHSQAKRVLQKAYKIDPTNQRVLNNLIQTNLILGDTKDISIQLRKLMTKRRPNKALLAEAYNRLGSDLFLFTENRRAILVELGSILR